MRWLPGLLAMWWTCSTLGCAAPQSKFPNKPFRQSATEITYDVRGRGRPDFALQADSRPATANGKLDVLAYDDEGTGRWSRWDRLSDYSNGEVPHLIILLDSIPFEAVRERYERGEFRFFDTPQKLIGPSPSLTELIFTRILHAPPLHGMTDDYYNRQTDKINSGIGQRLRGFHQPWEL